MVTDIFKARKFFWLLLFTVEYFSVWILNFYFIIFTLYMALFQSFSYKWHLTTFRYEILHLKNISVQFSSFAQSCPTLCDPMNRSTPGLPVHHYLPEFTQTYLHRVCDAIQPSHPRSSPSPPAPNPSQHQSLSNESTLRMRWPKYWSFSFSIIPSKEIPGLISFRMDWLDLL